MKLKNKLVVGLLGLVLAMGIFATRTGASEWDKRTIVTVNQPMQVQDTLLQPGTYIFKLLDSSSDRHVVQIFNGDQSHIINTILAIPAERRMDQITGHTNFTFWETPDGYAKALRTWYYPGDTFGQEFRHPKHLEMIASAAAVNTTTMTESSAVTPAPAVEPPAPPEPVAPPVATEPPVTTEPEVEASPTPVPEQPQAAPAPAPEQAPPPAELPKTASPYPLFGFSGLICLGLYGLVHRKRA